MTFRNVLARATIGALVAIPILVVDATASTNSHPDNRGQVGQYCITVIKKLRPGGMESEVVSRKCTTNSAQIAQMRPLGSALLVHVYVHRDFVGLMDEYYGNDGPCDSAGYGIPDTGLHVRDNISSYRTFGTCNRSTMYREIRYGGAHNNVDFQNVAYVGDAFNDHLYSMWVKCQWPVCSPRRRPPVVPTGGHGFSPTAAR